MFPWVWDHIAHFPFSEVLFSSALALAAGGVIAIAIAAARRRTDHLLLAVVWLHGVLLANVVVHVALSVRFQGYVPGFVTACLALAPACITGIVGAVRHERLPMNHVRIAVLAGAASYLPALLVVFACAWSVLRLSNTLIAL